jgi:hypothetical protein
MNKRITQERKILGRVIKKNKERENERKKEGKNKFTSFGNNM